MTLGAAATREQIATTPRPPCGGGGLSLWVNAFEHIGGNIAGIPKIIRSIDSFSLSTFQAVSTFFHKSNSFANQRLGSFRCNLFSNEKEQGVGAVQQKLGEEAQGKTGATNE